MRLAARMTLAVVPLVLLALPASVAWADPCVTPKGSVSSSYVSESERNFTGNVKPFGPLTGHLTISQVSSDGSFTGYFELESKKGTAFGTIDGQFLDYPFTYTETLTFLGGTGKYAGISGSADVEGTMNPVDGTGKDSVVGGEVCLR